MYEVEVKVEAEHGPVRRALEEADAERIDVVTQVDTYFDAPHRDFAQRDEALRLREERTETGVTRYILTYKGPKVDAESKTRKEVETTVADQTATVDLLSALGFSAAATVSKKRERYAMEGYTVTLDSVDGLGSFVEVESTAPEAALEEARDGANAVLRRLGLDPNAGIRTSYLERSLEEE